VAAFLLETRTSSYEACKLGPQPVECSHSTPATAIINHHQPSQNHPESHTDLLTPCVGSCLRACDELTLLVPAATSDGTPQETDDNAISNVCSNAQQWMNQRSPPVQWCSPHVELTKRQPATTCNAKLAVVVTWILAMTMVAPWPGPCLSPAEHNGGQ
jgi:hypothetical protein